MMTSAVPSAPRRHGPREGHPAPTPAYGLGTFRCSIDDGRRVNRQRRPSSRRRARERSNASTIWSTSASVMAALSQPMAEPRL